MCQPAILINKHFILPTFQAGLDDTLGHSDSFRRTWDTARFEKMAKEKADKDGDKDSKRGAPYNISFTGTS